MIEPITKEYFYKSVGKVDRWRKILNSPLPEFENEKRFDQSCSTVIYFEYIGNGFFAYIPALRLIVIPSQYDFSINKDEHITFDSWGWRETGKGHNEDYTINLFHRTALRSWGMEEDMFNSVKSEYKDKTEILLYNDRIGYSKKVELRFEDDSYSKVFFVGFEEKTQLPYDGDMLAEMEAETINILLWSQKKL